MEQRWISGDHCCCVAHVAHNTIEAGKIVAVDMLAVYEVNKQGEIIKMAAHWSFDDMLAKLEALQAVCAELSAALSKLL
ncbi:MAG: hypothetical protein AAGI44_19665 [Pseudomonadota bacterium]